MREGNYGTRLTGYGMLEASDCLQEPVPPVKA